MRAWLVLAMMALAGCSSDAPESQAPTASTSTSPPAAQFDNETIPEAPTTASFSFTACRQLHGVFFADAAEWEGAMPDGFEVDDSDGDGLVNVLVEVTLCDASRVLLGDFFSTDLPMGMELVTLPVIPPVDAGDGRTELLAIDSIIGQDDILDAIQAVGGGGIEPGEITLEETDGAAGKVGTWRMIGATHTYSVRSVTSAGSGTFGAVADRIWFPDGDTIHGVLERDLGDATDDGTGTAAFLNVGGGDAPPILPGIGHRITGMAGVAKYTPLTALDWYP